MGEKISKEERDTWMDMCNEYFDELAEALKSSHEIVESVHGGGSRYLVLKGTGSEITYYGKPLCSFRVSDHWNWHANLRKCINPHHIQCFCKDIHYPFRRPSKDQASRAVLSCSLGYYGIDRQYHVVCGEVWDSETKDNKFIRKDIQEVIRDLADDLLIMKKTEEERHEFYRKISHPDWHSDRRHDWRTGRSSGVQAEQVGEAV